MESHRQAISKECASIKTTDVKKPLQCRGFFEYGGETQDRTGDTRIFNPLLYLLSYHADAVY